jgi:kynurenine formamidase
LGPVPEDNWGRWGDEDERGALNLVTPERTLAAAGACKTGKVYPLGMPIGNGTPPVFGRPAPLRVSMAGPGDGDLVRLGAAPDVGQADDLLILPSHSGTHMDALSHVVAGGTMWNGHPAGEITTRRGARRCGIERSAAFAARAVLLDVAGHSGVPLVEPGRAIGSDDLEACRTAQGVDVRQGDVLLVRTGWTEAFARGETGDEWRQAGLDLSAVEFVRDHDIAAVGSDNSAVEMIPFDGGTFLAVHIALLVRLGVPLIEHLWLADLAADRCWEALLAVGGLAVKGATGSPVNPIAIG